MRSHIFSKASVIAAGVGILLGVGCLPAEEAVSVSVSETAAPIPPPSFDPENAGGWVLNEEISDEFNGGKLDGSKWFVEGAGGQYYVWKGRAPSQFAPHNVLVEGGILKIRSQWEPDFEFATGEGHEGNVYGMHKGKKVPVTTGGVISLKRFLYGYMEVRSKAGNAAMTSSFWSLGYQSELDIYEQMGKPSRQGDILEDTFKSSIHNWSPPAQRPTRKFGHKQKLSYRVADDFHVFGVEWGEDFLKWYIDGELVHTVTQKEVGKDWVLTNPLEIWLDSEIFDWLGVPTAEELPVDYEIDYVRIWQKPSDKLMDQAFYSFEGPILFEDQPKPMMDEKGGPKEKAYQKFWWMSDKAKKRFEIVDEKSSFGRRSLKVTTEGELDEDQVGIWTPPGALDLPAGEYELSMDVWIEPENTMRHLCIYMLDPQVPLSPVNLSQIDEGKWITVKQKFTTTEGSGKDAKIGIILRKVDVGEGKSTVYVDAMNVTAVVE